MGARRRASSSNIHESFSDVALLMLATFVFLLVTILITTRLSEENQLPKLEREVKFLRQQLEQAQQDKTRLLEDVESLIVMTPESELDKILEVTSFGRKDFDVFIEGLQEIPGKDLHLIVDASGSMHGLSSFLIPVLRVIVIRSGKELAAITWFSDNKAQTYSGSMGETLDQLLKGAPFAGNMETIGRAFRTARANAAAPGAYVLIGDEPSDDIINYSDIPSPVFALPVGRSDPMTESDYQTIADKTNGKLLRLDFR